MSNAAVNESKVATMAEKIKAETTIDKATGVGTSSDDVYAKTLPEDLTMEIVGKVSDHNTTFVSAATKVAGQLALEAMKENKELQRGTIPFRMGVRDQLTVSIDRQSTFPNPQKPEEPIVKMGASTIKMDVRASHNSGTLKTVRAEIGKLFAESLK